MIDLIKSCKSPWFLYPLVLAFFFTGFAGMRTSKLVTETCEKAYYKYSNLKREPIDWKTTIEEQRTVKTYLEFSDQELKVIEEDASRAKLACELGFHEANKDTWKYGLLGWSFLFLVISAVVCGAINNQET